MIVQQTHYLLTNGKVLKDLIDNKQSGDGIPLGSIINYDGTEIPNGYELYTDIDNIKVNDIEPTGEARQKVWIQNTNTNKKIYILDETDTYNEFITKSGDSLPVGTIVEYNGTEIPDGYAVYEDPSKYNILWEGDIDGTSSITLTEDVSNYKKVLICSYIISYPRVYSFYPSLQNQGQILIDFSNNSYQYHYGCHFSLTGTTFKIYSGWARVYDANGSIGGQFTGGNQVHITKVIGCEE